MADNRTLPNKEAALFRTLVKQYETKQYKKGIKTADSVLRKFSEHGETLAMKGLLLNCLERKEEAYELVKRGVKADLRSHVCWHVYGLLYRSDREYDEAIKCYKNALRMDKENLTVLKDLALLQIQMRDLPGFLETRQALLELKSSNRQNWVAFALAHHLCGNHQVAATVLESYEGTVDAGGFAGEEYEHSELLLYKARILEEGGLLKEALAVLGWDSDTKSGADRKEIKDRLGAAEAKARMLCALGDADEAEALQRILVAANPENYEYHAGLRQALALEVAEAAGGSGGSGSSGCGSGGGAGGSSGLPSVSGADPAVRARLESVYAELAAAFPHSTAIKRIPLDFQVGEAFTAAADAFVRRYLSRGIPSLFSALRPLLRDPAKAEALGHLFRRLEAGLVADGCFPPLAHAPGGAAGAGAAAAPPPEKAQSPQALVWTRFYLAQHCDALGDTGEALRLIDDCIQHTPTLIELYTCKARILKHAGDVQGAAALADAARSMDLADRYLNCVAAKALFRADKVEQAESTAAMFTRDGEQANNLFDMQATWYEISSGRAYLRLGQHGKALKRFLKVDAHFADFVEDQFDFHGYCLRKQTMRAYVDMLRMEDALYAHPVYGKAVAGAVQAYLQLADGAGRERAAREAAAYAAMAPEEQKKVRQKKQKEEQQKAKAAADAAAAAAKKGDKADQKKVDADPDGVELAATADPLGEATKLVRRLAEHAGGRLQTHLLAFEVYIRKQKYTLALQAAKHAVKLVGASNPVAHSMVVRIAHALASAPAAAADGSEAAAAAEAAVQAAVAAQVATLLGGKAPAAYHEHWAGQHAAASLAGLAANADLTALLQPAKAAAAVQELLAARTKGASHAECVKVHELLSSKLKDAAAAQQWKQLCGKVHRWSAVFEGPERVAVDTTPQPSSAANGVARKMAGLAVED